MNKGRIVVTKQRRERERAELRQQILLAAREIASQEGWQAVTVRKVAERIEYSHAAIYAYFDNKKALLFALLLEGFALLRDELRRAQSVSGTPEDLLQCTALAYWNFAHAHPELYQVMNGLDGVPFGTAQTPIEARESFVQLREAAVRVLEQFADLSGIDVNREVDMFWAALHGLVSLSMAGRLAGDQQRAMELVVSTSERFSAAWRAKFH